MLRFMAAYKQWKFYYQSCLFSAYEDFAHAKVVIRKEKKSRVYMMAHFKMLHTNIFILSHAQQEKFSFNFKLARLEEFKL